jgi:hypothetical protein
MKRREINLFQVAPGVNHPRVKRKIRGVGAAIVLLAQLAGTAFQTAAEEPPPPAEVAALVRRFMDASGGEAAIRKQTVRSVKGVLKMSARKLELQVASASKAPDKQIQTIAVPGLGAISTGYDGKDGWTQGADGGVTSVTRPALKSLQRDADFWRTVEITRVLKALKTIAGRTIGGTDTAGIEGLNADGKTERLYFAKDTGLLRAWDMELFDGTKFVDGEIVFDDYREVSGVKVPWRVYVESPEAVAFEFQATDYATGGNPPDERFRRPGGKF